MVLPAYNEAENIRASVRAVLAWVEEERISAEVIVVDDGSSDATVLEVGALQRTDARIKLVRHAVNLGYGAALRSGFAASSGEYVFFTDADLQFRMDDLRRLSPWVSQYDIVVGYRDGRADPRGRRLNAWMWNRLINSIFRLGLRDVDCAFKVFHRRVLQRVGISSIGAFVNSELLVRAASEGFRIKEVPVPHYPRLAGRATGARLDVIGRACWELATIYPDLRLSGKVFERSGQGRVF